MKKSKLTKAHYHEIAHTAWIISSMIEQNLNRAQYNDPAVYKIAEKATKMISEIYLYAGGKM